MTSRRNSFRGIEIALRRNDAPYREKPILVVDLVNGGYLIAGIYQFTPAGMIKHAEAIAKFSEHALDLVGRRYLKEILPPVGLILDQAIARKMQGPLQSIDSIVYSVVARLWAQVDGDYIRLDLRNHKNEPLITVRDSTFAKAYRQLTSINFTPELCNQLWYGINGEQVSKIA